MTAGPVFEVKTTDELTIEQIANMARLFEAVFHKPCPIDLFERKFAHAPHGRPVHSLLYIGGDLVGAFSAIPIRYRYFGRELLFAITADLMILPAHRGSVRRLQRLADGLYRKLETVGVAFVFCCLRDEIFQVHRAVSKWRAIGKVHYYAAPASRAASGLLRAWNSLRSRENTPFAIEKVNDEAFAEYRYRIFPSEYKTVSLAGGSAVYASKLYYPIEGVPAGLRLGLLIDVFPLTPQTFDAAVKEICARDSEIRVLAYQGRLPFRPGAMFQVPGRFEKQAWTLGGRILAPDRVDDRIFDIGCWNINLSNGDLV